MTRAKSKVALAARLRAPPPTHSTASTAAPFHKKRRRRQACCAAFALPTTRVTPQKGASQRMPPYAATHTHATRMTRAKNKVALAARLRAPPPTHSTASTAAPFRKKRRRRKLAVPPSPLHLTYDAANRRLPTDAAPNLSLIHI